MPFLVLAWGLNAHAATDDPILCNVLLSMGHKNILDLSALSKRERKILTTVLANMEAGERLVQRAEDKYDPERDINVAEGEYKALNFKVQGLRRDVLQVLRASRGEISTHLNSKKVLLLRGEREILDFFSDWETQLRLSIEKDIHRGGRIYRAMENILLMTATTAGAFDVFEPRFETGLIVAVSLVVSGILKGAYAALEPYGISPTRKPTKEFIISLAWAVAYYMLHVPSQVIGGDGQNVSVPQNDFELYMRFLLPGVFLHILTTKDFSPSVERSYVEVKLHTFTQLLQVKLKNGNFEGFHRIAPGISAYFLEDEGVPAMLLLANKNPDSESTREN